MTGAAKYYIAQLTPDLFRREQTNVGIIVLKDNDVEAKFIGERPVGELDKRQFKSMDAPNVYVQWVDYWRRLLKKSDLKEHDLFAANGGNFNIVRGGEIDRANGDSAKSVAEYLYPLLVSDGGLIEALGKRETARRSWVIVNRHHNTHTEQSMSTQAKDLSDKAIAFTKSLEDSSCCFGGQRWGEVRDALEFQNTRSFPLPPAAFHRQMADRLKTAKEVAAATTFQDEDEYDDDGDDGDFGTGLALITQAIELHTKAADAHDAE